MELVVVISLMSMMLFFAVPRFQATLFADNTRKVSLWVMGKVPFLKDRSMQDQKRYALHIDMDAGILWMSHESMTEEELQTAKQKGYKVPDEVRVSDVEFVGKGKVSTGRADIYFYPKGYSDRALIHIRDYDNHQRSFLVEPFLSRVKLFEEYIGF